MTPVPPVGVPGKDPLEAKHRRISKHLAVGFVSAAVIGGFAWFFSEANVWEAFEWLLPLIAGLSACIAFYVSKPERSGVAVAGVALVCIAGAWEAAIRFKDLRSRHEAMAVIQRRLLGETDGVFSFISDMIFRASDGWLPKSEEEFFSAHTARLMCRELDVSRTAPVLMGESWLVEIDKAFSRYRRVPREAVDQHSPLFEADLISAIDKAANAHLLRTGELAIIGDRFDRAHDVHRAPLLSWGLEPLVEQSLVDLNHLYQLLRLTESDANYDAQRQWLVFPLPHHKHLLGESRFGPDDLREWRSRYPNSPGPATFGPHDPNKGSILNPR